MQKMIKKSMLMVLSVCLCIILSSCSRLQQIDYYSNQDNYVNATGTVVHIAYDEDNTALYLGFDDLDPEFDDTCFKIIGDNLPIVQENGIDEQIQIGDTVEFITAPKYFGDGYVMPIVAIYVDEVELLGFDEGFENFIEWLEQ